MRIAAVLLLLGWLVVAAVMTLTPAHPLPGQVVTDNATPLLTIRIYLDNLGSPFWVGQLIGNLVLFLPFGLFGPVAVPALRRWWLVILVALAISAGIETAQLWIPDRSADVDDVIVNVTGAMFGFVAYRVIRLVARAPT